MASIIDLVAALVQLGESYQDHTAWAAVVGFCKSRWEIPAALVATYLAMVYSTRRGIPEHPYARQVDQGFAAWNLGLSLFSGWGVWHMVQAIAVAAGSEGFFFTVCAEPARFMAYSGSGPSMLALALFCLSKIPELGDTVFLVLKRRPVRLLQWYHHATVMLFCWLALATEYPPGIWFAATNYAVHTIMYMYFFLMTFPRAAKIVKPVAPLITIIQIAQMVWGLLLNGFAVSSYMWGGGCNIHAITVYAAVALYGSYFWLFSRLFLESRRAAKRTGACLARQVTRKVSEAFLGDSDDTRKALDDMRRALKKSE